MSESDDPIGRALRSMRARAGISAESIDPEDIRNRRSIKQRRTLSLAGASVFAALLAALLIIGLSSGPPLKAASGTGGSGKNHHLIHPDSSGRSTSTTPGSLFQSVPTTQPVPTTATTAATTTTTSEATTTTTSVAPPFSCTEYALPPISETTTGNTPPSGSMAAQAYAIFNISCVGAAGNTTTNPSSSWNLPSLIQNGTLVSPTDYQFDVSDVEASQTSNPNTRDGNSHVSVAGVRNSGVQVVTLDDSSSSEVTIDVQLTSAATSCTVGTAHGDTIDVECFLS